MADEFGFPVLPREVQLMIWEFAAQPSIVSTEPARDGLPSRGSTGASALSAIHYLSRELQGAPIAPALLRNLLGSIIHLDLAVDTVKVFGSFVPKVIPSAVWPGPEGRYYQSPIRKLLCASPSAHIDFNLLVEAEANPIPLDLERWPVLEELTFVYTRADVGFFLRDYIVQGPTMNGVPAQDCQWHTPLALESFTAQGGATVYDRTHAGAKYYRSKGIDVDSGIRWRVDKRQDLQNTIWERRNGTKKALEAGSRGSAHGSQRARSERRGSQVGGYHPHQDIWANRPNVGLHGMSYDVTSCGGIWAGFRIWPHEGGRVEFSPLGWDDVKDTMYACQDRDKIKGHFPEMIVKIFVVQPGRAVPRGGPHCSWEAHVPQPWMTVEHREANPDEYTINMVWHKMRNTFSNLRFSDVFTITQLR